jgi:hypothetical protein
LGNQRALSGADIWRTLNIERETLNIEIRDAVPSSLQRSILGVRCSMFIESLPQRRKGRRGGAKFFGVVFGGFIVTKF